MFGQIEQKDIIRINVQRQGSHDILFKLKMKTNFRKVKRAYAQLMDLPLNSKGGLSFRMAMSLSIVKGL